MKFEYVLCDKHPENERHGGGEYPPQKQTETQCLDTRNEPGTRGDANHGDEYIQTDRIHKPYRRIGNAPERRVDGPQPAEYDSGNERPASSGQGNGYGTDLDYDRTHQCSEGDRKADKRDIGR